MVSSTELDAQHRPKGIPRRFWVLFLASLGILISYAGKVVSRKNTAQSVCWQITDKYPFHDRSLKHGSSHRSHSKGI